MPTQSSPLLALPYIQAAQAQKHVTHNEALRLLDISVQLTVQSRSIQTPPDPAAEAARYIVPAGATNAWDSREGEIAIAEGGAWWFLAPNPGWQAYVTDEAQNAYYQDDNSWVGQSVRDLHIAHLGINTNPDSNNALTVAGNSSLFTHDGAGHQLVLNKAAPTDTASLLFQTAFSGRVEIGTAGGDNLEIKTSADGSAWQTALSVDCTTAQLSIDQPLTGLTVMQSPTDTSTGRLMRADYGYGPGNLLGIVSESGGLPTGAVIETTETANGRVTRFADGTQICTHSLTSSDIAASIWPFPQSFAQPPESCHATVQSDQPYFSTLHTLDSTQLLYDCWDTNATRQAATVMLTAIGRWF